MPLKRGKARITTLDLGVDASVIEASIPGLHKNGDHYRLRHGHAAGHVRDTYLNAAEVYLDWVDDQLVDTEPQVSFEVDHRAHEIPISRACTLVWGCTDCIPGDVYRALQDAGLEIGRQTYAACARAMRAGILERMEAQQPMLG
jgi:hypothetical protein